MGYKLYREVRDLAGDNWSHGELLAALMIADDANDLTRLSYMSRALLCQRAHLTPKSLTDALARLGIRGYEFRISHGTGDDGREVYAARAHATDFCVPDLSIGSVQTDPIDSRQWKVRAVDKSAKGRCRPTQSTEKGSVQTAKGSVQTDQRVGADRPPFPQSPHISSGNGVPVADTNVEGNQPTSGQDLLSRIRPMSAIERAALQAAESRRLREGRTE